MFNKQINSVKNKLLKLFENRSDCYQRLFTKELKLTKDGQDVLQDLCDFAKYGKSERIKLDALEMAKMQGRREVIERIIFYINLTYTQRDILKQISDNELTQFLNNHSQINIERN